MVTALFEFLHGDDMTNKYAVVKNGVVDNVIISDDNFAQSIGAILISGDVSVGDLYNGSEFSKAPPLPIEVPKAVTMRQARLALLQAGKLGTVNAAIASMSGAQGEAARIEWDYSNEVQRAQPLVSALGGVLGMTSEQLDQLFITAATL